ncbi:ATP-dependent helicase HrpA [Sulfuricella denitrificans skB26]|uniref:ATP-dependent helicase HrpA n=1 Tax=Sulfuricella denitrificans (strain DSM 22764 / NBRC 105220 / skB26) TaxID=1163617 RepID=S6B6A0_SULDS|nr:ATP-dependent helicase HrpA [Sulfuricella denitrificans skB26]
MISDRHAFRRQLDKLRALATANKPMDAPLQQLQGAVERSAGRLKQRLERLPVPTYPEELPVSGKRADIAAAIAANQVVIVCGETGSGKTTQLPKICLELQRGAAGLIGHTQPRRIAARTVASRISQELKSPLGQIVGYKVRFSDHTSADSYVKLMTDGILLAETQNDRFLSAYDTIIIDEAHERSLNIDFLLGYLKQILPKRPDLKVIVTSATIDAERFSNHFDGAPVIEVSGRLYPVEMRYRPLHQRKNEAGKIEDDISEANIEEAILDAVDEVSRTGSGDILIFLPGEREIRDTAEALRKHHPAGSEILPLFARLSAAEQERVFKPGGARRIVLATNVAETSLTVPGIRYVIDPGYARLLRYSYRSKVERLQVEKISQASANQRAGRCGRVMSGVCVRLYAEEDFNTRPAFTDPEIRRSNLAAVILRMKALGLADIEDFPFLEPPDSRAIVDGFKLLEELGAVDAQRALTETGRQLAKFPIDPRIARMILAAKAENCLTEVLIIASALSVQDPRDRPMDRQQAADDKHRQFQDDNSDFVAYIKLWAFYDEALKHKKSNRKLLDLCREHFLSATRLREWREIHGQLHAQVVEIGLRPNQTPASYEEIHRALLAGLLGNLGVKTESQEYAGAREIKFHLFPGSVIFKKAPKWVMAAELTETTKLYARCAAKIEPEWVEKVAVDLLRRHYFDPHWEKTTAQVAAYERVSLYGLTLVPRRRVHYGTINPIESRDIFIKGALVAGEFNTRAPFFEHNRKLVAEVEELEHKSRRQDVLVDEERIYAFYDARIPEGIHNGADFDKWRRGAEAQDKRLLFMNKDDLMRHGADAVTVELFPETLMIGETACRLAYRFEPGHPLDGVTLSVPLHLLNQMDAKRFDWLVPGMIREKLTVLVKGLPKRLRSACVPVPDFVTAALMEILPSPQPSPIKGERAITPSPLAGEGWGEGESRVLSEALAVFLRKKTGQEIPPDTWKEADLPLYLRMNFKVVDESGAEMASGRDLAALKENLGQAARLTFASAPELDIEKEGLTNWDFGDLPEKIAFTRHGQSLTGYPALEDDGDSVSIRLFDTPEAAESAMRAGVRRLLRLALNPQMKQLEKSLPGFTQTAILLRSVANPDDLKEDLLTAITDRAFLGDDELPRTTKDFATQKDRARTRLAAVSDGACRILATIATDYQAIQARLAAKPPGNIAADIREQLVNLVYKGFLNATPWEQLQHLPRYLKATVRRLEKLSGAVERDAKYTVAIRALWQDHQKRLEKHRKEGISDPELHKFRWMMEELRVSMFAQELKTPYPVSVKRLQKAWEGVKA